MIFGDDEARKFKFGLSFVWFQSRAFPALFLLLQVLELLTENFRDADCSCWLVTLCFKLKSIYMNGLRFAPRSTGLDSQSSPLLAAPPPHTNPPVKHLTRSGDASGVSISATSAPLPLLIDLWGHITHVQRFPSKAQWLLKSHSCARASHFTIQNCRPLCRLDSAQSAP